MSRELFLIVLAILLATAVLSYVVLNRDKEQTLIGAGLLQNKTISSPIPSSAPPQAPKTFSFDATTDLKAELEKVNPQVLDSDFNE